MPAPAALYASNPGSQLNVKPSSDQCNKAACSPRSETTVAIDDGPLAGHVAIRPGRAAAPSLATRSCGSACSPFWALPPLCQDIAPMPEYQNNPSFVLRNVEDVVFEDRPVPERAVNWTSPVPVPDAVQSRLMKYLSRSRRLVRCFAIAIV